MKTITFLRHAEYEKSKSLSDRGIYQAKTIGKRLKRLYQFDLIISSSALRAKETAEIIFQNLNADIPIVILEELYLPMNDKNRKLVKSLLKEVGDVPLNEYIKHDKNHAWKQYAEKAYKSLLNCILKHKAENILVIGHGNIINSLGLMINPEIVELKTKYFNYCEGFTIFSETKDFNFIS